MMRIIAFFPLIFFYFIGPGLFFWTGDFYVQATKKNKKKERFRGAMKGRAPPPAKKKKHNQKKQIDGSVITARFPAAIH